MGETKILLWPETKGMKHRSCCLEAKYLQYLTSHCEDNPTLSLAGSERRNALHLPEINWYVSLPCGENFKIVFLP